ncbi:MAG: F0F1 ATP synthase subunit A [Myxococcota bacterium]
MNPHHTWFHLLPGYARLEEFAGHYLARDWRWMMFQDSHFTLSHVLMALLVFVFLVGGAIWYRASVAGAGEAGLVPPPHFGMRALLEMLLDAVLGMMEGVMGREQARRYLPLIGTLAFLIFFSNLLGLIPGFLPPTDTLKTNLALSLSVFVMTHVYGIQAQGLAYFKHFFGPILKWYALPLMLLMFVIEIISHLARPVSLALRLMGNIAADHKVVAAFFALVPLLIPLPFMLLGVLVAIVQTLVFSLLTTVYIGMAVAHGDHEEHGHAEAHGH